MSTGWWEAPRNKSKATTVFSRCRSLPHTAIGVHGISEAYLAALVSWAIDALPVLCAWV